MKNEQEVLSVSTISPGSRLRVAREAMKLTQADVGRYLRLSSDLINAIENDDYSQGPRFVFIRGYLRTYAALVNEDPDHVVSAFNELNVEEVVSNRPSMSLSKQFIWKKQRTVRRWSLVIALGILTLFVIWWHLQKNNINLSTQLSLPSISITKRTVEYGKKDELIEEPIAQESDVLQEKGA